MGARSTYLHNATSMLDVCSSNARRNLRENARSCKAMGNGIVHVDKAEDRATSIVIRRGSIGSIRSGEC